MKRSEMMAKIELELAKQAMEAGAGDIGWVNADYILKALENAGMQPPHTKANPSDFANLGMDQKFIDEHKMTVSRWDPEE